MILSGHSLGGCLSILCAIKKPKDYNFLILFSPCVKLWDHVLEEVKWTKYFLYLSNIPFLKYQKISLSENTLISCKNPQLTKEYYIDPMQDSSS